MEGHPSNKGDVGKNQNKPSLMESHHRSSQRQAQSGGPKQSTGRSSTVKDPHSKH
ncbi:hypothetical protein DACRYDRAFT_22500 [Dacryopinax primogenitus]|uniref:Uncharacterized protein n=1 Tax=Dacryopinax primogenitus (strain DJM 731) TaxID=1858805 RepID=M5FXT7_DACPD|nr:uncharacterized protein DACRYDRAFT_22500 [Dacryopinax primogenitus]EJU01319.1 hypothetical protein DACRYDRAFT_22500 [Dacryopinax primogenitus]